LASRTDFRSAGYGGALAKRARSQILGPTVDTEGFSPRKAGRCERNPQIDPCGSPKTDLIL
jgi:hypothetical protein